MSGRTRSRTVTIDPDKLRLFCRAHGGPNHVSKTIGYGSNYLSLACGRKKIGGAALDKLCAAYAKTPSDFLPSSDFDVTESNGWTHKTYKPKPTGAKPVTNEPQNPNIVDELIGEMESAMKGTASAELPKIKVGGPKLRTYPWQEKTLQEMTGEDLARLGEHLLTKLIVEMEMHSISVDLSLKREGSKYGW